jgi:glycosyltransferase involved in cell wall biosynthesis
MRGGEKVLESLCRLFPSARLSTLVHVPGSVSPAIEQRRIRTSLVQHLPNAGRWYREFLPLFPTAIELFDLDDVDLVVSTSHCASKAVVPTGRAVHICYCHTPMRYVWDQFDAYFGRERLGRWPSLAARGMASWLARWDRDTAGRVTRFVANSRYVAGRIGRYYNRPATVIHPPVDTRFFAPGDTSRGDAFLVVSALVPYKRIDVAIRAAALARVPLKIVGTGPDEARLRAMAGPGVEFLGALTNEDLRELYRAAIATVLPAEEDFGIAPVESLACGRPVIALNRGGARETVIPHVTGLLVDEQTPEAFAAAMNAMTATRSYDSDVLRAHAERFATDRFEASFTDVVHDTLTNSGAW